MKVNGETASLMAKGRSRMMMEAFILDSGRTDRQTGKEGRIYKMGLHLKGNGLIHRLLKESVLFQTVTSTKANGKEANPKEKEKRPGLVTLAKYTKVNFSMENRVVLAKK